MPTTTAVNNDINLLSDNFKKKFTAWRSEVIAKYPNAVVFEWVRSQLRQDWLYAQWRTRPGKIVTWTRTSNHSTGNAVDVVFRNNGKLERAGPYNELVKIAKKYGIRNLWPDDLSHFEDDGIPYKEPLDPVAKQLVDMWVWNWEDANRPATRHEVAIMLGRVYNILKKK